MLLLSVFIKHKATPKSQSIVLIVKEMSLGGEGGAERPVFVFFFLELLLFHYLRDSSCSLLS